MVAGGPAAGGRRVAKKTLSWHHLVGVTFFAVCGGDYGVEDAVGAAGARLTLLGLLLLPWLWSLPIALMTAELGSMIPEAGGYVVWVHRAFGPFWAHQNAVWNLVSNAFDNALYPVMFVDYLRYFPALRLAGVRRWLVSLTMLGSVTGLNLLGVDVVATASTMFALLVISPFGALVVAGLPELDPAVWAAPVGHEVRWGTFLSVLLWNTSGYDSVGALAAEVVDPGRDFPRAMVATIVLVTLVYVLPLGVAVCLDAPNLAIWSDGHFTTLAAEHVGEWLSAWISLGGALSAVGLLNTLLCTAARVAVSAARISVLPKYLTVYDEATGVPRRATLCISAVLALACALPFSELVSISMLFYGATTFLEFLSLVRLRIIEADTPRPYRIPLGTPLLALACVPPMLLCGLLLCLASPAAWLFFIGATALSVSSYFLNRRWSTEEGARNGGYGEVRSLPPAHCPDTHVDVGEGAEPVVRLGGRRATSGLSAAAGLGVGVGGGGFRGNGTAAGAGAARVDAGDKQEIYRKIAARARERIDSLGTGAAALATAAQMRGHALSPPGSAARGAPRASDGSEEEIELTPAAARASAKSPLLS